MREAFGVRRIPPLSSCQSAGMPRTPNASRIKLAPMGCPTRVRSPASEPSRLDGAAANPVVSPCSLPSKAPYPALSCVPPFGVYPGRFFASALWLILSAAFTAFSKPFSFGPITIRLRK